MDRSKHYLNENIHCFNFFMGVVYKPSIPFYWPTDEFFHTPIFQKAMTRSRFLQILKFLHFSDSANPTFDINDDGCDQLHKVRLLIELLRDCCKRVYAPVQNVNVDESLVLFKG